MPLTLRDQLSIMVSAAWCREAFQQHPKNQPAASAQLQVTDTSLALTLRYPSSHSSTRW